MDLEFIPLEHSEIYINVESIGNLQSAWNLSGTGPFPILHPLPQIYNLLSLIPYSYSHFPKIIFLIISIGPMPISLIPYSYSHLPYHINHIPCPIFLIHKHLSLIPFKLANIDINMKSIWDLHERI